jgi:hypothetical protein
VSACRRHPRSSTATLSVVVSACLLLLFPLVVAAQQPFDLHTVAITPDDLSPGFVVIQDQSSPIPDVGVMLQRQMQRAATPQNIADGPIFVAQLLARIDRLAVPEDFLDELGKGLAQQQGLVPAPDGPNEHGRFALVKREGESVIYTHGYTKANLVIVTIVGGLEPAVSLPSVIALSSLTGTRYDTLAATPASQPQSSSGHGCAFVKGSGPTIYSMDNDTRRVVPDWDTYLRKGGAADLSNVCAMSDDELNKLPEGPPLPKS